MKHTTASSIRMLAKQVPSVLDKNVTKILEQVKETVIADNRRTACLSDMAGSTLEDTQLVIAKLIELGFEVELQHYSFFDRIGNGESYPSRFVNDLIVSWDMPECISQVGDKIMNQAEFDGSIASMKKAVRIAWDVCQDPSCFVGCTLEVIREDLITCDDTVALELNDLREKLTKYFEWYA